jgi:hypothetical protein
MAKHAGAGAEQEARLARTPLEPATTYTDDPLRVLRTVRPPAPAAAALATRPRLPGLWHTAQTPRAPAQVRFTARFGLSLAPPLCAAARSDAVVAALGSKISRERVAAELEKMVTGACLPAPAGIETKHIAHITLNSIFAPTAAAATARGLPTAACRGTQGPPRAARSRCWRR